MNNHNKHKFESITIIGEEVLAVIINLDNNKNKIATSLCSTSLFAYWCLISRGVETRKRSSCLQTRR